MEREFAGKLLSALQENARVSTTQLAERFGVEAAEIENAVRELEKSGAICGYTAILNEEMNPVRRVKALIEVKVTPKFSGGFDYVARKIAKFPEVSDVVLVSGSYDLLLTVQGETLQEVAAFVASKLATIDGVISTSTGFILKKYKESGRILNSDEDYERLKISF